MKPAFWLRSASRKLRGSYSLKTPWSSARAFLNQHPKKIMTACNSVAAKVSPAFQRTNPTMQP
jgi:hypothetical protein